MKSQLEQSIISSGEEERKKKGKESSLQLHDLMQLKKNHIYDHGCNRTIPLEIIDEILYRLPVKSLLRFKCVCKRWLSTISDPSFNFFYKRKSNSVFVMSLKGRIPSFYTTCDSNNNGGDDVDDSSIGAFSSINVPPLILNEYNNKNKFDNCSLVSNACNGLILLRANGNDTLILFNPSTRYFVKALSLTLDCLDSDYVFSIGLCYDPSIDDYKALVVRFSDVAFVSCLKSKQWVKINVPFLVSCSVRGPLVKGHIHWMTGEPFKTTTRRIIYFDATRNIFEELPSPPDHYRHQYSIVGLGDLDGCLCVARKRTAGDDVELVAMKKYGVAESWTSLFVLPNFEVDNGCIRPLMPLLQTKINGEEFLFTMNFTDIWTYNPRSKSFRKLDLRTHIFHVTSFVQTIVTPAVGLDAK